MESGHMFEYFRGTLAEKTSAFVVVDVQGVGYLLDISLATFQALPATGATITLFAHYHVREDIQRLFGFITQSERAIFRQLINVNKIGPKVAMNILSHVSAKDFVTAVNTQNATYLKSVPGVGLKTAQRLIMELKGKLSLNGEAPVPFVPENGETISAPVSIHQDALDALISLGYSEQQVQRALMRVQEVIDPAAPVEEWIRKALQVV
jgi:Holliday junction DNA helicase RuvA